jgi:hypothetical protein
MVLSVHDLGRQINARCGRVAVVVLGMHRSGTSSTAGTLVRLGGAAPLRLIPPGVANERGFWESSVIVDLNDDILAAGGSEWRDLRKFDPDQIDACTAETLRARARAALADEFGQASFPVLKDPRMCRLMPFWAQVFDEAEWSVRALLPVRSPLEVCWSLKRRDGLSPSYGCLLWLRHVLEAEAETRGMPRAILNWPQLLSDPATALSRLSEQLDLSWPSRSESALAEIDAFVSADLRHEKASDDDLRVHPAVNDLARETYASMLELVEDPGNVRALRRLDGLRARFEAAGEIFGDAMCELEGEIAAANTTIAHFADRYAERSRDSKQSDFLDVWKRRRRPPTLSLVNSKDLEAIRNSVFFDAGRYLEANPDVRAAGMDAALHYLLHGGREGRDPGPLFSTEAYLARRPDVAAAGVNALLHYETHGRREDRHALRNPIPNSPTAGPILEICRWREAGA